MKEQINSISKILGVIGIGACSLIFWDMREDIKIIKSKVETHSERILILELRAKK